MSARELVIEPLSFELPDALEAHEPPEARGLRRDQVRLLVTSCDGYCVQHLTFTDLPNVLRPGDLLVANDSATLPAALTARTLDGRSLALHVSTRLPADLWVVEPRVFRSVELSPGQTLELPGGATAHLLATYPRSARLWVARLELPDDLPSYLARWGRPIQYPYVRGSWPIELYQTVYASAPGSAEMPSAGRPFSPDVLEALAHRGIGFATLTLHTGVASLEQHEAPYVEEYTVPPETAAQVRAARAEGRRVIAVGTTGVRALESAADLGGGSVVAAHDWTDLVITPERGVRAVDGLLTGFHEPRASHLAMLEAIAGRRHLERAYAAALEGGYLWHEFGDVHLIV
jgi:S-adenosylmethionine:tRNA ribosyltransferase-isomerase